MSAFKTCTDHITSGEGNGPAEQRKDGIRAKASVTPVSTTCKTGVTTLPQTDPAGTTTIVTFVPITGALTTIVSSATQTGVTTLPQTDPAGTTTVVTFVPITGALTTVTSTASQTGITTLPQTNPAGTTTIVTYVTPSPSCTPGLRWAYYGLSQAPTNTASEPGKIPFQNSDATSQANWKTTYFNIQTVLSGQSPNNQGLTTTVGLSQGCGTDTRNVYGTTEPESNYIIVQHIGYFHPATSGTYTFSFSGIDDSVYLWLGKSVAKTGYSNSNYDKNVNYYDTNSSGTFTFTATAGQYYPIRILFVNAQQCGSFNFSLTNPSGNVVVSNSQSVVGDQLVTSCPNNADAAPFSF
ncbi:hypothetical protein CSIM01_03212 [Colletotrichum simmondsii]|uniref:PA14 domain-containing protein n=1 Tax=Colletotrichum simmondsii TaxID=703756 RepID=A0A135SBK6_9PEZI|nr:hypothetical protein CSIM01_03212 [Colletotrichum simmondsii]